MRIAEGQSPNSYLKVFYDGGCVICSKEIEMYRDWDTDKKIKFVDISLRDFDPISEGLDPSKVQRVFHVKDSLNNLHTGVDGFVLIWDSLGIFKPLSLFSKNPVGRALLDLGYFAFTKLRPFLPRKDCSSGTCKI